jgi:hypothetical protein
VRRAPHWLLPLACALVPAVAVHVAWLLSRSAGAIPDCIPHFEGCTSISRAARYGIANLVFKAMMLPAALLQALHWRAAARWLAARAGPHASHGLLPLGIVAGVALAVYATFLGTEGAVYGWLRRYGITFYFAATFIAMLLYLRQLRAAAIEPRIVRGMVAMCALMLVLGLASTLAQLFVADDELVDRMRDAMEWQLGALFTAWFLMQAMLWRRAGA